MIRAIVFDCFGVLTSDGWLPFKRKYFEGKPELFEQATEINRMMDAGLADYDDFIETVARLAGVNTADAKIAIENNVPDDKLFDYIRSALKSKYKIGLLSNAGANWLNELFGPDQVRLFDAAALSFETGLVKPDERAYLDIAQKLGVTPEECVFIDDQERYCTGATDVGMQAIWYKSFEDMRPQLEALLVTDTDN